MAGLRLTSRDQIKKLLSTPTWSVQELLSANEAGKDVVSKEQIAKLLRQSGLNAVDSQQRIDKMQADLSRQLTFVELLSAVDTEGLTPLVRIGAPVSYSYADITKDSTAVADEITQGWKPTDLASIKDGNDYVLREGLKRS